MKRHQRTHGGHRFAINLGFIGVSGGLKGKREVRRLVNFAFVATLLLLAAACIPRDKPISPDIDVVVVDAVTRLPIKGATVTVWGDEYPDKAASAITDEKGHALIQSRTVTRWMFPAAVPFASPTGRVHIKAAGYQALDLDASVVHANSEHQPVKLTPL